MWLVENKAILTKENMVKRNWQGDPTCYFCDQPETVDHLLFGCKVVKVVWAVIASGFNVNHIPRSYEQFWTWMTTILPNGMEYYMFGLAAICWDKILISQKRSMF